jgi:hypothetical protein
MAIRKGFSEMLRIKKALMTKSINDASLYGWLKKNRMVILGISRTHSNSILDDMYKHFIIMYFSILLH